MAPGSDWRYLTRHADEGFVGPTGPEHGRKRSENYYLAGQAHGEPAGIWWGKGAKDLGLAGEVRHQDMETTYGAMSHPVTGEALGQAPRHFASFAERVERLVAREGGDVTPERRQELELAARKNHREARHYFDLTFSPSKSWSVLHAALERQGRHDEAAEVWASWMEGVSAGLEYLERECGYSRAGYHGTTVAGRTSGRWIDAHDWVVSLWRHHMSRDGEPQLARTRCVLNRVQCGDGVWRTLDSHAISKARRAAGAVSERVAETALGRRLGVSFAMRPDGKAREVVGIHEKTRDLFSSRRQVIKAGLADLVAEYNERHGAAPTPYVVSLMAEHVTLKTRARKPEHAPTRAELLDRWELKAKASLGLGLDEVAEAVSITRGQAPEGLALDPDKVISQALAAMSDHKAVWSRYDLIAELNDQLPDVLGDVAAESVVDLLDDLADMATAPGGEAVRLTAPELVPTPPQLRRADGRSVFEPHNAERFATRRQLQLEERLIAVARADGAPALDAERAGEVVAATRLAGSQADAVRGLLSSGRRLEVLIGPAGMGKSFTSCGLARLWSEELGGNVFGITVAERARQVLAAEGIARGANVAKFLNVQAEMAGRMQALEDQVARLARNLAAGQASEGEVRAFNQARARLQLWRDHQVTEGDLVIVDEASMISTLDLERIVEIATKAGAKVVVTGDDRQLSAVGSGGAMGLLTREVGAHELVDARRFAVDWERKASLRLRDGDGSVLVDYDRHGRLVEGTAEEMIEAGVRGYVADHLAGRRTVLVVPTNEQATDLSGRVRSELVALGRVEPDGLNVHNGTAAGIGDLVQMRENNYDVTDARNHPLINRGTYEVVDRSGDALVVRRLLGRDDNGQQRYAGNLQVPGDYVAEHVELAYASTTHSAQGLTVDISHSLIDEQVSREGIYVGLTRATDANLGYVVTQVPSGDHRQRLETDRLSVLAGILERGSVVRSATEVRQEELEAAESLGRLAPIWSQLVGERSGEAYAERLRPLLGDEMAAKVAQDPAAGALWRLMRQAELAGTDVEPVLAEAITSRELTSADSAAQVLYWRLDKRLGDVEPTGPLSFAERTPQRDDPVHRYARQLAEAMDRRVDELGERAAAEEPAWSSALGPVPEDPLERMRWAEKAGTVAAYRESYGFHQEHDAIGPAPAKGNVEARAAWQAAYTALGAPDAERIVAGKSDAELANLVRAYEREEVWVPAHVDAELRNATLAERHFREQLVLDRARQDAADERAERLANLEALVEHTRQRVAALEEIAEARAAWHAETQGARALAQQARAVLDQRKVETPAPATEPRPGEEPAHERHEPERSVDERESEPERAPEKEKDREPEPEPEHDRDEESEPEREQEQHPEPDRAQEPEPDRDEEPEPGPVQEQQPEPEHDQDQEPEPEHEQDPEPQRDPEPEPERDQEQEAAPERDQEPERDDPEMDDAEVALQLDRARRAAELIAQRRSERERQQAEAQAARERDYARRSAAEHQLDHEVHDHEVQDHEVSYDSQVERDGYTID